MTPDLEQAADGMCRVCNETATWLFASAAGHKNAAKLCSWPEEASSERQNERRTREVADKLAAAVAAYEEAKRLYDDDA